MLAHIVTDETELPQYSARFLCECNNLICAQPKDFFFCPVYMYMYVNINVVIFLAQTLVAIYFLIVSINEKRIFLEAH